MCILYLQLADERLQLLLLVLEFAVDRLDHRRNVLQRRAFQLIDFRGLFGHFDEGALCLTVSLTNKQTKQKQANEHREYER